MTNNIGSKNVEIAITDGVREDTGGGIIPDIKNGKRYRNIKSLYLQNFMGFSEINLEFCDGINIIHGENSTGKTSILKVLYSTLLPTGVNRSGIDKVTKTKLMPAIVNKYKNVFRPDNGDIGRMVNYNAGAEKARVRIVLSDGDSVDGTWGKQATENIELNELPEERLDNQFVYFPPKEIISSTENYVGTYEKYEIGFEETYYDLVRLLLRPNLRTIELSLQDAIDRLQRIIGGEIVLKNGKFYVKKNNNTSTEMSLLSEGYKKIVTLIQLIKNGSIDKGTVLFWDEPEANMNPKMISQLVKALISLAQAGVTVFISSHNYFVQQELQLEAKYSEYGEVPTLFISLYEDDGSIKAEIKKYAYQLDHNSIMEEFDAVYDREQELMSE